MRVENKGRRQTACIVHTPAGKHKRKGVGSDAHRGEVCVMESRQQTEKRREGKK